MRLSPMLKDVIFFELVVLKLHLANNFLQLFNRLVFFPKGFCITASQCSGYAFFKNTPPCIDLAGMNLILNGKLRYRLLPL